MLTPKYHVIFFIITSTSMKRNFLNFISGTLYKEKITQRNSESAEDDISKTVKTDDNNDIL